MKSLNHKISLVFFIITAFLIALFAVHKAVVATIQKSFDNTSTNISKIEYSENLLAIINTVRLYHARTVALSDTTELFKSTMRSNRIAVDSFYEVSKLFKLSVDDKQEKAIIDSINTLFITMNQNFEIQISNKFKDRNYYFKHIVPHYIQIQNLLFSIFNSNIEEIHRKKADDAKQSQEYFNAIDTVFICLMVIALLSYIVIRFVLFSKIKNRHNAIDDKLISTFPDILELKKSELNIEEKINLIVDYYTNKDKENLKYIINEKSRINNILNNYCDTFFVLDKNYGLKYYNQSAKALFGFDEQESLDVPFNQIKSSDDLFSKFAIALNVFIEDMMNQKNCHIEEEFVYKSTVYQVEINALCNEAKTSVNFFLIRFYNSIR